MAFINEITLIRLNFYLLLDGSREGPSHGSSHQEIGSIMSFNSTNTTASQPANAPASPRQHGQPLMSGATVTMPQQGHPHEGGITGQTPQQLGTKVSATFATIIGTWATFHSCPAGKIGNAYLCYHYHQMATCFPLTTTLALLAIAVLLV